MSNESGFSASEIARIRALALPDLIRFWDQIEDGTDGTIRALCLADLYYLMVRVCGRVDMLHPWVYGRVREVEAAPDNHVDLCCLLYTSDAADE